MKIFFDARWTRIDFHDGISRYGAGVIEGFKENNIPITLIIKDKRQLKMLPSDIPYILVNDPLSFKELFLAKKLNKLGADVVFSPFQIIGTWGRKYKLVLTLHDTIFYLHPKAPTWITIPQKVVWRLFHMVKWPQRFLLNSADQVVTVSNYSKKNISDLKLTKREISVVYNAPFIPKQTGKIEKTKNILYMGAFMPYKNAEVLISGMEFLPKDFTLHLLTKILDERKAELAKLIKPGVNVVFHNGTTDDDYFKLLAGAYCLATGSKEEGFGLPLVEAMTMGTPVVCSDITIFHEVAGQDAALFFDFNSPKDFANQVKKLDDPKFRADLIERGHKQAEKFTWKKSAMDLYHVLQDLVSTE